MFYYLLVMIVPFVAGQNHGHGHGNHGYSTDNPLHINNEIVDLNVHFGTHFCLDLLLVDCRNHVTVNDEAICGSDGKTYVNHCYYAHAQCMFEGLSIQNHGSCVNANTPSVATTQNSVSSGMSSKASTTASVKPTTASGGSTTMASGVSSTMSTGNATTAKPASAVTIPQGSTTTTQSPETVLFQQVFCKNKDSIVCPANETAQCGSDGVLYTSRCAFSKAKCNDLKLSSVDVSLCSPQGVVG